MKFFRYPVLILFLCLLARCQSGENRHTLAESDAVESASADNAGYYGEKITDHEVTDAKLVQEILTEQDSVYVKLTGQIMGVCKKKGCWMNMDVGNGEKMRVTFKDYQFFVPKDVEGKTAVIEGVAKRERTSVDDLRHYAEDAGKTREEIQAITEPEEKIVFEAIGVIIKEESNN